MSGTGSPSAPGASPLDRARGRPLWVQILDDLRRRLARGEHLLVAEYDVSRHTVREALRVLRAEGVVSADRGRQPRLVRGAADVVSMGAVSRFSTLLEIAGLRFRGVVRAFGTRGGTQRSRRCSDSSRTRSWSTWSVSASHERIAAIAPTVAERRLLGMTSAEVAYAVDRLSFSDEVAVEFRRTVLRSRWFGVTATFSGSEGYRMDLSAAPGGQPGRRSSSPRSDAVS